MGSILLKVLKLDSGLLSYLPDSGTRFSLYQARAIDLQSMPQKLLSLLHSPTLRCPDLSSISGVFGVVELE